ELLRLPAGDSTPALLAVDLGLGDELLEELVVDGGRQMDVARPRHGDLREPSIEHVLRGVDAERVDVRFRELRLTRPPRPNQLAGAALAANREGALEAVAVRVVRDLLREVAAEVDGRALQPQRPPVLRAPRLAPVLRQLGPDAARRQHAGIAADHL